MESPTPASGADIAPPPPARFDTLALDPKLLRAVADSGYTSMTPIQAKAIPIVLAGRDVMGAAQTGTGKTAAFTLPLLQKMLRHENASASPARHPVRALVLAPTRELADQVANNVKTYAKHTQLRSTVVFGGIDMKPQTLVLKGGVEVLIAAPGRLLDHIEAKNCVLNQVEYVVLDEADRMLDIGFLPDLQRILAYLPKQRQTLLFSATFSPELKRLAQSYLQDPITVEVARPNATASTVEQRFYSVSDDDKRGVIRQILRDRDLKQAIVFVNSKLGAARLARSFERDGLRTAALHGDKSQDERLKSLAAFKAGEVDLLVATDVAARGLDIADLPAVFNFDVPFNAEDYSTASAAPAARAPRVSLSPWSRVTTRDWCPTSKSSSRKSSISRPSSSKTTAAAAIAAVMRTLATRGPAMTRASEPRNPDARPRLPGPPTRFSTNPTSRPPAPSPPPGNAPRPHPPGHPCPQGPRGPHSEAACRPTSAPRKKWPRCSAARPDRSPSDCHVGLTASSQ